MAEARRILDASLLLLPGVLVVYFSFNAGGFFPGTVAFVAVVLLILLASRIGFARSPFAGSSPQLAWTVAALGLYAVLCLLSGLWSDAWARALIGFNRTLLYLLVLLLFGLLPSTPWRVRWLVRALAIGMTAVAIAALATRLLPEVWSGGLHHAGYRLSYPLTYWNALGLLSALALVLCAYEGTDAREPPLARILGTAAVPVHATVIFYTFSRGAVLACVLGLLVYLVIGRPRAFIAFVLTAVPATAVALIVASRAHVLIDGQPSGSAAIDQGHHVALVLGACVVGAAAIRALLSWRGWDERRSRISAEARRRRTRLAAAGGLALLIAAAVIALTSGFASREINGISARGGIESRSNLQARLTNTSNNGRFVIWHVALNGFDSAPVVGHGTGTFELLDEHRSDHPNSLPVVNAHSLYLENLAELGIVGLVLVLVPIGIVLVATGRRARGDLRPLFAAVLGAMLAWALSAGIDWNWQMPAVTLPFFALGGLALARPPGQETRARAPTWGIRGMLCAGCALLAIAPALMGLSQAELTRAAAAFQRGDCTSATEHASAAISRLSIRPEPYEIRGYCEFGTAQAVTDMRAATDRDPDNWEFQYSLAVAQAAVGQDPREAIHSAHRLDPLEPLIADVMPAFASRKRQEWLAGASEARIPERLALQRLRFLGDTR